MSHDFVLFEASDGVATLTLNDPAKLNALSRDLQNALRAALARVREDKSIRAVILTGAGRAFSSGADLSGVGGDVPGDTRTRGQKSYDGMDTLNNPLIRDIAELPVPVVCAANGPVAGGSVGIALSADVVIAARSAYFYMPFMPALGIIPDMGASWFMPRAIGRARSVGLTLLGNRLSAEQAVQWGLIWACVDDAALAAEARATAEKLAALPGHAALETRRAYAASERNTLSEQLDYERDRQRDLIDLDAFGEGVSAFMGKRKPVFRRD